MVTMVKDMSKEAKATNQDIWTEIRNEYIDITKLKQDIIINFIDAWTTNDDNEEGNTIVKVIGLYNNSGVNADGSFKGYTVIYLDERARNNNRVKEYILDSIAKLKEHTFEIVS